MSRATRIQLPVKPLLALALLLAALAALLCRPAASPARAARSACSASSAAARHVRACAGRTRSGRSHGKAGARRSGRRHPIKKKKKATRQGSAGPAATLRPGAETAGEPREAECADGSDPEDAGYGAWTCEDGSGPVCPEGSQLAPSGEGSELLCLAHGESAPPADEEDEGESEDGPASARAAIAS
jgi:hypothetical protein